MQVKVYAVEIWSIHGGDERESVWVHEADAKARVQELEADPCGREGWGVVEQTINDGPHPGRRCPDWYFTFPKTSDLKTNDVSKRWVRITAKNCETARAAMVKAYGQEWEFCYPEEGFTKDHYPGGELEHLTA